MLRTKLPVTPAFISDKYFVLSYYGYGSAYRGTSTYAVEAPFSHWSDPAVLADELIHWIYSEIKSRI